MANLLDHGALALLHRSGMTSRWVQTGEGRIHVLDGKGRGDLPTVLLFHGLSSRATHFRRLINRLLPHVRRVVVPDLLGHGLSEVPAGGADGPMAVRAMDEVIGQIIDEPFVVYGNSMGGYGALKFAARFPGRALGVVVTSPGGAVMPPGAFAGFLERFRLTTHDDALAFLPRIFSRPVPFVLLRHAVAWAVRRQLNRPSNVAFIATLNEEDSLRPEELARLVGPALMMWGTTERLFPREHFEYFRGALPAHVLIEEPEGYGHLAYLERTEHLADRIVGFMRTFA